MKKTFSLKTSLQKLHLREKFGLLSLPTWTDIGLAPVAYVVATFLAYLLFLIFELFPWFDANEIQTASTTFLISGFDRLLAFISIVIITPIVEEIIFRGLFYGKLREKLNFPLSALIVSLVFAIAHGQWNVGINVFALSLVLCSLREITGTTYAGILTHMLKNGIAFYLLYII